MTLRTRIRLLTIHFRLWIASRIIRLASLCVPKDGGVVRKILNMQADILIAPLRNSTRETWIRNNAALTGERTEEL